MDKSFLGYLTVATRIRTDGSAAVVVVENIVIGKYMDRNSLTTRQLTFVVSHTHFYDNACCSFANCLIFCFCFNRAILACIEIRRAQRVQK